MGFALPHFGPSLAAALVTGLAVAVAAPADEAAPEAGAADRPDAEAAVPKGWTTVHSEPGGFSVLMPRRHRQVAAERADAAGPTRSYTVAGVRPVAFGGRALYTARCLVYAGSPPPPAEVFDEATGDYDALGYLAYRRERPLGEHPGIEFLVRDDQRLSYGLIYHLGSRVCTLSVESPRAGGPSPEDVARFWDSFVLASP